MIKITIEHYDRKVTTEVEAEDLPSIINNGIVPALVAVGFLHKTISDFIKYEE